MELCLDRAVTMTSFTQSFPWALAEWQANLDLVADLQPALVGRAALVWGWEDLMLRSMTALEYRAKQVHKRAPDAVLQGCIFEFVSRDVEKIAVPAAVLHDVDEFETRVFDDATARREVAQRLRQDLARVGAQVSDGPALRPEAARLGGDEFGFLIPEVASAGQAAEVAEPSVAASPVLEGVSEEELLGYGVPPDWLGELRSANEDELLELAEILPDPRVQDA